MKKLTFFISTIVILFCLVVFALDHYSNMGKADNVNISIGKSHKFTREEINSAVSCIKEKFRDFKGCNLTKIWYNEEKSTVDTKGYLQNGKGLRNGTKAENVIVLLSDFTVDSSGGDGSFNPNSTYTSWSWTLIRSNKKENWKVDDWGY